MTAHEIVIVQMLQDEALCDDRQMMIIVQMSIHMTERITVIILSTEQQYWAEQQLKGGRQ